MRKSAKSTARRAQKVVIKKSVEFLADTAYKLPGGDKGLARLASDGSAQYSVARGRTKSLESRIAHLILENAPQGIEDVVQRAEDEGFATAGLYEQAAVKLDKLGVEADRLVELQRKAVRLDPKNVERRLKLAEWLLRLTGQGVTRDPVRGLVPGEKQVRRHEAIEELRIASKVAPENSRVLYELGRLLFAEGDVKLGLDCFEAAVRRNPRGDWLIELGSLYRKPHVAQFHKSFIAYERAFEYDNSNSAALSGIVNIGVRATLDWPRIWGNVRKFEGCKRKSPYRDEGVRKKLDSLFTSQATLEHAKSIRHNLDAMASRGRHLHPEVQRLVANRVQFLGDIAGGFELHRGLAGRRITRLLKSPVKDVATLRRVMQALLYVGDFEKASQLSDPRYWALEDPVAKQRLEKLYADSELMRGRLEPYLVYSEKARADVPLLADQKMEELVRGKKIAIVGPADTGDRLGALIDSYDVIVRTNFNPNFVAQNAATMGTRTDIAYYGGKDLGASIENIAAAVEDGQLEMVVGRALSFDAFEHLEYPWLRFARQEFPLYYHGFPLGVQRIAYDLIQFRPENITLFNTDFFTGKFTDGYRDSKDTVFGPGSLLNDLIVQHDLMFDFEFMKALKSTGVISAQGKAAQVLGMSTRQYIHVLESENALGGAHQTVQPKSGTARVEVEPPEAQDHLRRARELLTARAPGMVRDAVLGLVEGEVPSKQIEALAELRKALSLAPAHPVLLFEIGNLLFAMGEVEEGLAHIEAAVAKSPRSTWLRHLGDAYRKPHVAHFDKALTAYERAFRANSKDSKALAGILNIGARATLDWDKMWTHARQLELRRGDSVYEDERVAMVLEQLFSDSPDYGDPVSLLGIIKSSFAEGRNLSSQMLTLIITRLQFMGHLGVGYQLRELLAEQDIAKPARDSTSLRRLLRALAYLDKGEQAVTASDPRFWDADSESEILKYKKLHADAKLLQGDAVDFLEYSSKIRNVKPLPIDEILAPIVEGKRVAVVGPADTGDQLGKEIDSYDVVVRPKLVAEYVESHKGMLGSRTDVTYMNGQYLRGVIEEFSGLVAAGQLKAVVGRPLSFHAFQDLDLSWLGFYRQEFSLYFHGTPLGIPRIVYDILQYKPSEISIFNTDFYVGERAFSPGYRDSNDDQFAPGSALNDLIVNHDLLFEFKLMKSLVETGMVVGRGRSGEVLELTPEEYVQGLEESGALS